MFSLWNVKQWIHKYFSEDKGKEAKIREHTKPNKVWTTKARL